MNHNLRYGLYLGLITVAFSAALFFIDYKLTLQPGISWIPFAITIAILIIAGRDLREQQGGYLPFKEAFVSSYIIYLIGAVITTVYIILQYNVFAPEAAAELQKETLNQTAKMLEGFGMDDQTIDQAVAEAEKTNPYSASSQLIALGVNALIGLVVCLIVGAIVKKNKPEFE